MSIKIFTPPPNYWTNQSNNCCWGLKIQEAKFPEELIGSMDRIAGMLEGLNDFVCSGSLRFWVLSGADLFEEGELALHPNADRQELDQLLSTVRASITHLLLKDDRVAEAEFVFDTGTNHVLLLGDLSKIISKG